MPDRPADARVLALAALSLLHHPPVEVVRAAGAAGFSRVGLRVAAIPGSGVDHDLTGNAARRRELRRVLDDTGVQVLDAEIVRLGAPGDDGTPDEQLLAAACELGARFIGVVSYEADTDRAAHLLGRLAAQAQPYGLSCLVEFMGFSGIKTLAEARAVVDLSGADNAHILVDTLHVARTGTPIDEIARLEPGYLPMAQICDAAHDGLEPDPVTTRAEAVSARLDPGTGALPLVQVVRALPDMIPLSVEVPCPDGRSAGEHARALHAAASAVLARV